MTPILYILTGPTAVGKTELSLQWAEIHQAEILSCDALLFYRGMDIGTAKPDRAARQRIAHHGIDLCPVNQVFSIAEYLTYAREVVDDILSRGKNVLITGGSGFYLKSFFEPVVDSVQISQSVLEIVDNVEKSEGLAGMLQRLKGLNPRGLSNLDLQNPRRVRRALERCLSSGKSVCQLQEEFRKQGTPFDRFNKKVCLLIRKRESLKNRIWHRAESMLDAGLVDEVRALLDSGLQDNPSARRAIGYREVIEYLNEDTSDRKITRDDLKNLIATHTNQLVKKQMTWFRHQLPDHRQIDLDESDSIRGGGLFLE